MQLTGSEHNPSLVAQRAQRRTMRLAWLLLAVASSIFCLLLAAGFYTMWHYHVHATTERSSTLIVRAPEEWVTWQRATRAIPERARNQQVLHEGDRVHIASSAGYGQAATVRLFDNSTLDMWAGADLLLRDLRTSRWNQTEQTVVLEQTKGYIRYDLLDDQPYEQVNYIVQVGDASISLAPGGSYSIDIVPPQRRVVLTSDSNDQVMMVDIAARAGSAEVQSEGYTRSIQAGQRVVIDPAGIPSEPMPAFWELIRDGNFSQYSQEEYNNTTASIEEQPTLVRSDTWQVYGIRNPPDAASVGGVFNISEGCQPPQRSNDCPPDERVNIAWFFRSGGQTKPFVTGIRQTLGAERQGIDLSEFRSLRFSIWVRILYQSIPLTGDEGTECPVMIRFLLKENHPTDAEQERVICFYAGGDPTAEPERAPGITYYRVVPYQWYKLTIDLREDDWLPTARYMRSIAIYANGHDYDARVTGVSLIGSHYAPQAAWDECGVAGSEGCDP
jgi:hypothetical protein